MVLSKGHDGRVIVSGEGSLLDINPREGSGRGSFQCLHVEEKEFAMGKSICERVFDK